jgi:hypothetical protein
MMARLVIDLRELYKYSKYRNQILNIVEKKIMERNKQDIQVCTYGHYLYLAKYASPST